MAGIVIVKGPEMVMEQKFYRESQHSEIDEGTQYLLKLQALVNSGDEDLIESIEDPNATTVNKSKEVIVID